MVPIFRLLICLSIVSFAFGHFLFVGYGGSTRNILLDKNATIKLQTVQSACGYPKTEMINLTKTERNCLTKCLYEGYGIVIENGVMHWPRLLNFFEQNTNVPELGTKMVKLNQKCKTYANANEYAARAAGKLKNDCQLYGWLTTCLRYYEDIEHDDIFHRHG